MADVPWPGGEARCPDQIDVVGDVVVFSSKWLEEAVVWDWRNGEFIAVSLRCYFIDRVRSCDAYALDVRRIPSIRICSIIVA